MSEIENRKLAPGRVFGLRDEDAFRREPQVVRIDHLYTSSDDVPAVAYDIWYLDKPEHDKWRYRSAMKAKVFLKVFRYLPDHPENASFELEEARALRKAAQEEMESVLQLVGLSSEAAETAVVRLALLARHEAAAEICADPVLSRSENAKRAARLIDSEIFDQDAEDLLGREGE